MGWPPTQEAGLQGWGLRCIMLTDSDAGVWEGARQERGWPLCSLLWRETRTFHIQPQPANIINGKNKKKTDLGLNLLSTQ